MFASKDSLLTRPSGYTIARSVRLRSSASGYFSRTPSASSRTTWTWSAWVKRGKLGSAQALFSAGTGTAEFRLTFTSSDTIEIYEYTSPSYNWQKITTAVYRDPSAWYHIQLTYDTTNGTAGDRVKLYVNGVQVTSFGTNTNPTSSFSGYVNSAVAHGIGSFSTGANYLDGYLTEINFIDGQALTPSSFGETDSITGVWKPKAYSGSYGTNGFELNFSDNSNNTAATIGKDYSGNGNNWTPNNISVTTGATYDSMTDVPTLTSATAANYPVSNVLDIDRSSITTSNGNLTLTKATANDSPRAAATFGATSGKFYAEITWTSVTNTTPNDNYIITGVTTKENWTDSSNGYNNIYYLAANNGLAIAGNKGGFTAGSFNGFATYGSNYFASGNVIGIALNLDAGTVTFYLNNVSQGAITLPTTTQPWFFYNTSDGTGNGYTANWNFGQQPFTYTPPTGFVALNTYNLPASTITNGAAYMAATTWTGTNTTGNRSVTGVGFQPDFVWAKVRSSTYSHALYDSVRGAGANKELSSNGTTAEGGENNDVYGYLSSFDSDGFSSSTGSSGNNWYFNQLNYTYVAWAWKAGTTSASNTNGSITSTVSVGATQGFSVVTYTGTGANATVGHGLGVAPQMIIIKGRDTGYDWRTYHASVGNTSALFLNTTSGSVASSTYWNNTSPTSSVFSVGSNAGMNGSTNTYVAYCFSAVAGYSAFGSYTGNGSADGPFVYTGFRPRWVMIKRTDSAEVWGMWDTSRDPYNTMPDYLNANNSNQELAPGNVQIDSLSNGFKVRNTWVGYNASGGSYVYMTFAENPFKNSLAR